MPRPLPFRPPARLSLFRHSSRLPTCAQPLVRVARPHTLAHTSHFPQVHKNELAPPKVPVGLPVPVAPAYDPPAALHIHRMEADQGQQAAAAAAGGAAAGSPPAIALAAASSSGGAGGSSAGGGRKRDRGGSSGGGNGAAADAASSAVTFAAGAGSPGLEQCHVCKAPNPEFDSSPHVLQDTVPVCSKQCERYSCDALHAARVLRPVLSCCVGTRQSVVVCTS